MLLRQYLILLKRGSKKIINLLFMISIPLVALYVKSLPAAEKGTVFICGYYMEDDSPYLDSVSNVLTEYQSKYQSCFLFESCSSVTELKEQVASGKYDCGYVFETGFADAFVSDTKNSHILLYTTPSSMYPTIFSEIIFDKVLSAFSPAIASHYLETNAYTGMFYSEDYADYLKQQYDDYMNSDSVFKLSVNQPGTYQGEPGTIDLFPVHEITGFILFLSALIGLLAFLKDTEQGVYARLSATKRLTFCILNILANMTPAFISGFITLLLYEGTGQVFLFSIKMLGYISLCILFCLVCLLLFRQYKRFVSALPVIVISCLIFSPIFIDLQQYAPILKYIAYLFPTTFF